MPIDTGLLDRRVKIQLMGVARDASTGAEVRTWSDVVTVWASVKESSTSTVDTAGEAAVYARPTRVTMRWREGIARETHRLVHDGRPLRIIGTAELGRREGLQLACQEWSHD